VFTVKVAGVVLALQLGHKLGLLAQQRVPVERLEKRVRLDLDRAVHRAQPVDRVLLEQLLDQDSRQLRRVFRVFGPLNLICMTLNF